MRLHRRKQRGIVLMVCLVMLVLFLLLGITFTLTATQFREGAANYAASQLTQDDGLDVADAVLRDMLRGSNNTFSPMNGHSLLKGIYGTESIRGTLTADCTSLTAVGGQFVSITVNPDVGSVLSPISGYYNGCVMTMLDGPNAGLSRRIVDYFPTSRTFHVETFLTSAGLPKAGNLVLINGRPFSGEGNGYNPATGRTDAVDGNNRPNALLPNLSYFVPNTATGYVVPGGLGGMNIGCTAPDYNNPWLAGGDPGATTSAQIKPSWHDPALIFYWAAVTGTTPTTINTSLMRQISWRPLVADHPKFTGSNSFYTPLTGPWDVDNNGDGVPDSVWINPRYPVRVTADGRRYVPLVAMYIVDQDGKVNLNTAGTVDMTDAAKMAPLTGRFAGQAGAPAPVSLPPGHGYGPAEINPIYLLSSGAAADWTKATGQLLTLLTGAQTVDLGTVGTYEPQLGDRWESGRFGWVDLNANGAREVNEIGPGYPGQMDTLNSLLWTNLFGSTNVFTTPEDIRGIGRISLTHRGQPAYHWMGGSTSWIDTAYEQAVSHTLSTSRNDSPFTAGEYERIVRQYDVDANSSTNRLAGVAPLTMGFRDHVTFASWDVPSPSLTAPKQLRDVLRQNGQVARHITDLLRARVMQELATANSWTYPLTPTQVAQVNTAVNTMIGSPSRMLSPDLIAGLRFDINRLLGDGVDNNANGVIDEPLEAAAGTELVYPAAVTNALPAGQIGTQFQSIPFDHNGDGVINASDAYARQEYAKQLYVLLMLLADEGAFPNLITEPGLSDPQKRELVAQRLAQFAVNVVDYRDPDSICTAFEYDINPFDGWSANCDGIIQPDPTAGAGLAEFNDTQRRVVWGCEAPALLLSDGVSWHNIRTKNDPVVGGMADTTYDQVALPQGSTFIELYCPANPHRWSRGANGVWGGVGDDDSNGVVDDISEAGWPGSDDVFTGSSDIYAANTLTGLSEARGSVDLSKLDGNSIAANRLPVWRLAISAPHLTNPVSTLLSSRPNSTTLRPDNRPAGSSLPLDRFFKFNEFDLDPPVNIERVVWFCNTNLGAIPAGTLSDAEKRKVFYNRDTNNPVYVAPGRYLVVGPRAVTALGKQNDGITDSQQKIGLSPTGSPTVTATGLTGATTMPVVGTQIRASRSIICAADRPTTWVGTNTVQAIGLNISEPLPQGGSYYPEPANVANNDDKYAVPRDLPLDDPANGGTSPASQIYAQGMHTRENIRTVFLQRLADPTLPHHPLTNPYLTVDFMPLDLTLFNGDASQFDMAGTAGAVKFGARERGNNTNYNLWAPATTAPAATTAVVGANFFGHQLVHTLGFLNNSFNATPATPFAQCINTTDNLGATTIGDPRVPFPWITWSDRPYVSQYELLMVPASTPARLNFEFANAIIFPNPPNDPYGSFYLPFRHLLGFFQTSNTAGQSPQLGRIFDYLHVPSKYPESHLILNPARFYGDDLLGLGKGRFRPPFNLLSRYREPGRINLNTIYSQLVYASLAGGTPMPSWQAFLASRRGYAAVPSDAQFTQFDSSTPTCFGNPFRSQSQWDLNPALPGARREADVTLLRPDSTGTTSLLAGNTTEAYRNNLAHPYFRYQQLNRLGNLTTTRSNVFAVWITVGFFEVEPFAVDAAHPDGYALTTELGIDTGEVRRHKAFYVIDRTIPVGYENGRDYNTGNAILHKTHVE